MTLEHDALTDTMGKVSEGPHDPHRLVVPIRSYGTASCLKRSMRTAAEILHCREEAGELLILSLLQLPERTTPKQRNIDNHRLRETDDTATQLMQVSEVAGITAAKAVRLAHDEVTPILKLAANNEWALLNRILK